MRIDRVYTRGGDQGETSLIGGERVSKASPRLDCYGTVAETNATIGLVVEALAGSAAGPHLVPILRRVQHELFNLGAELAAPDPELRARLPRIEARHVEAPERDIDAVNGDLPPLKSFVLPGGGWSSAYLHLARTECRCCERFMVALATAEDVGPLPVRYQTGSPTRCSSGAAGARSRRTARSRSGTRATHRDEDQILRNI